jgi:hypothetical protein
MDPILKDVAQVVAWVVASIGGVIAAFKAVAELNRGRADRKAEFRWKQAEMAKTVLDETWSADPVRCALSMLDWSGRTYNTGNRETKEITHEYMWNALRTTNTTFEDHDQVFVRDCFDRLLTRQNASSTS